MATETYSDAAMGECNDATVDDSDIDDMIDEWITNGTTYRDGDMDD